ncbi:hypothetical protein VIBRN418_13291 [Vibrio sp. N418]|uniref:FimV/HubP family polar landmark protein n=1 Tax=Vibrio sp. (strain N418) TaxID=701176 RepID=UPI00021BFD52|nr:FimV/HubP family polar landmark protein [Vibrio sp. N418]EGU37101.1 hypothetical protein VIBRN418_13291 [Vibrio sp. N418]
MRRILQRLLMPIALVAVTQTNIVSAESIRLTGPNGELQNSPQYSEQITRHSSVASEPSRFYGPTSGQDTLWGISSRLKPSNHVSVQQTLLAIYQLNPQAFENQNIHTLIPGSTIRVPSLAQVQSVSTDEAVRIMNLHQARLDGNESAGDKAKPQTTKPPVSKPQVTPSQTSTAPSIKPQATKPTPVNKAPQVEALEQQLTSSESELTALEEKNHRLRLMLAEVQTEVNGLKEELGDENRIRSEVEKLLEAERLRVAEQQSNAPSTLDNILSNGWLVAGLAIVPGLLIGLMIVLLLGRKKAQAQAQAEQNDNSLPSMAAAASMAPLAAGALDDDVEDELDLDDDLFGESSDDETLFSDELDGDIETTQETDIFAGLDDSTLDFNLDDDDDSDPFAAIDDDGDLDESLASFDVSSNGISVDSGEKALGLEEMERALNDVVIEDSSEDDDGFDLSDTGVSQSELDDLFSSALDDIDEDEDSAEQAMLDELLSESAEGDDAFSFDNLLDDPEGFDLSDDSEPLNQTITSDSDIDDLFAQVQAEQESVSESLESDISATEQPDEALQKLEDESNALFDELFTESAEDSQSELTNTQMLDELLDSDENGFDLGSDEESIDLLDEWLDDSDEEETLQLSDDSTAMLDELLGEEDELDSEVEPNLEAQSEEPNLAEKPQSQSEESLASEADDLDDIAFDLDSVSMLDELLDEEELEESTAKSAYDADSTVLLDELLDDHSDNDDASLSAEDLSVDDFGDDGIDLFEELLEIEKSQPEQTQSEDSLATLEAASEVQSAPDAQPSNDEIEQLLASTGTEAEEPTLDEQAEPAALNDELGHIEESVVEEEKAFSSDDFLDDMLNVAPESDPLLGEFNFDQVEDDELVSPALDTAESVNESSQPEPEPEPEPEPAKAALPTVDNEFGTPSDDDWLFDGDSDTADALAALQEQTPAAPLEQVNETAQIDDSHNEPLTPEPAQSAESEFEPEFDFVEQDAETADVAEVEPVASEGDGSQHIDSVDAPDAPLPEPEPEPEHEEQAESVDVANDLPFEFDELELPEFGEEEALTDAVEHPAADDAQANESSSSASEEALDEPQDESQAASSDAFDEIIGDGVYDNEAASDEAHSTETVSPENMANEEIANDKRDSGEAPIEQQTEALETEPQIAQSDAEERFDFDDLDLPEYGEDDAIADFKAEMPNQAASMANELSTDPAFNSESELSDVDGETRFSFDDLELPEYGEADALADATAEMEQDSDVALAEAPVANEVVTQTPEPAPELSQEQTQELPQTQSDEVFEFDTAADPVEAEAAEQGSAEQEPAEIRDGEQLQTSTAEEPERAPSFNFNDLEPVDIDNAELDQRLDEQDVLSGLFGDAPSLEPAPLEPQEHRDNTAIKSDYDESAFNELLAEGDDSYTPVEKPIDQRASDSAGMDIDAMLEMGGEDWNGFSLSPELQASISDDIPEEDRHAWDEGNQPAQAKISNEDWENQDGLIDFNPRDNQYRTIDELMAEVDREEGLFNPDEEALKLDVGLSDFPDVIGQMSDIDVDSNAEASGKLDLAKIYMEMNDASGAKKLLEEAIVDGNDDIRREAKRLIDAINGR